MYTFIFISYGCALLLMLYLILRSNGNPTKTIAWLLVVFFLPLIGIVLYLFFGRNFRKRKLFDKKENHDLKAFSALDRASLEDWTQAADGQISDFEKKSRMIKLLERNEQALLTLFNQVKILHDGQEVFPAKLEAMKSAKHHIHLEYYTFEEGKISKDFIKIMGEKVKEGVEVRLLYDAVGSWGLTQKLYGEMQDMGIKCQEFLPIKFPRLANRINYRNHRKILIVDGKKGFIGGLNITDNYLRDDDPEIRYWRDTHLEIQGEAVKALQKIFINDWEFATKKSLDNQAYFPEDCGDFPLCPVQIASSGPDSDWASIMQAYFYAITTARNYIYFSSPYFIPNASILTALTTASMAGTEIRLLLPEKSDSITLNYGTRSYFEELLRAGIHIHLYQVGINHGKLMIVDGHFCSVGTSNLDTRSFDHNFEANAMVYDSAITSALESRFLEDLEDSRELVLEEFQKRSSKQKAIESFARLFSPLL